MHTPVYIMIGYLRVSKAHIDVSSFILTQYQITCIFQFKYIHLQEGLPWFFK